MRAAGDERRAPASVKLQEMQEFHPSDKDPLKWPRSFNPSAPTSRRVGIHTSIGGGVENAAERAHRLGCNAFQIFSTSPRQWEPYSLGKTQCEVMSGLRKKYDLKPLVIHSNYLINLAGANMPFLNKSIAAFRGELERGLALCADYLVLHPGSFRGTSREEGLERTAASIAEASRGLDLAKGGLTVLIENTAGAEFSLGGTFEQVRDLLDLLRKTVPIGACIDTCHTHVAGYDIATEEGEPHISPSRANRRLEECSRVALQRRQGRMRIAPRPSRTYWARQVRSGGFSLTPQQ